MTLLLAKDKTKPEILTGLGGLGLFIAIFGWRVIDPTNTDWLLSGGDLAQHYIGWQFFVDSRWSFPLGVASDLAYPHGLAITFMDSLPLLAIPFKLFSGLLPSNFQYFGLWAAANFVLQGYFAAKLMKMRTKDWRFVIAASTFVIVSPVLLSRTLAHTALASHWLILAAFYVLLSRQSVSLRLWTLLLGMSVLLHPYLFVMVLVPFLVQIILTHQTVKKSLVRFAIPAGASAFLFWLAGGFTIRSIGADSLGIYGLNVTSFFSANGWSTILPEPPHASSGFETLSFPGLGSLVLIAAALVTAFKRRKALQQKFAHISNTKVVIIAALIVAVFVVSVGPTIRAGDTTLISIEPPFFIERVLSVFRASARFFWVIYYALIVSAAFVWLYEIKHHASKFLSTALVVLALVQVFDVGLSASVGQRHESFANLESRASLIKEINEWPKPDDQKKHIVFIGSLNEEYFVLVSQYALEYDLTLNTGYFARSPSRTIETVMQQAQRDLLSGTLNNEVVYMTRDQNLIRKITELETTSIYEDLYIIDR